MTPLDLREKPPRGVRETILECYFLAAHDRQTARGIARWRDLGPFLNHDTGFSAYAVRRLGLDMNEFREAVRAAPDEDTVIAWLAERIDPSAAAGLNAKLETFVIERMSPDDQALVRERHPVLAQRPDLSKLLDIIEADDQLLVSTR
jgi:hypothetical protein